jgi:valyl-tRNA synthetase
MSKSLGNGIDPLEVIDKYGADALRLTLVTGNAPGNDMRFSYEKVESSRNFANKIWNASRFILMNLQADINQTTTENIAADHVASDQAITENIAADHAASDQVITENIAADHVTLDHTFTGKVSTAIESTDTVSTGLKEAALEPADKWILSRLNALVGEVTDNMENFELGIAVQKIYDFIWDEFCDWYIEMVKPRLYAKNDTQNETESKQAALWTLCTVLKDALKLLHPYMPFLTEEIYCKILVPTGLADAPSIMISTWPTSSDARHYAEEEHAIETLKEAVRGIRNLRSQMNVPPSRKCNIILVTTDPEVNKIFTEGKLFFNALAHATQTSLQADKTDIPGDALTVQIPGGTLYVPLTDLVDMHQEILRLQKEEQHYLSELKRTNALLTNEKFTSKAPAAKLAEEQTKQTKYTAMLDQVRNRLRQCEQYLHD